MVSSPSSATTPRSEVVVADALASLEDDWTVLHSVAWQGVRSGRQGDGEADFVLLHPEHGLVVLEVKGGGVRTTAGRWESVDRHGRVHAIKDPYLQATESKHGLARWLKERHGGSFPYSHAVALPGLHTFPPLGPNAERSITILASDLVDVRAAMSRVIAHWSPPGRLGEEKIQQFVSALAPTIDVRPSLADRAKDAEAAILKLTEEQVHALAGLRRNRRATVLGGAGTGKTVLAVEKARQLAEEGRSTALLCFNRPLAEHLGQMSSLRGVDVSTFHAFCDRAVRKAGQRVPRDAAWWSAEAAIALMDAMGQRGPEAIVVDEGQDFSPDWIEALRTVQPDGDPVFYVFADPNQALWERGWEAETDGVVFDLTVNCRNTRPIAETVARVADLPVCDRAVPGPTPSWMEAAAGSDALNVARDQVVDLLDGGFAPTDVVVLCETADDVRQLREMALPESTFVELGGNGVVVETIGRFKGLEATAAVVLLSPSTATSPDRSAYVAFSRAKAELRVVAERRRRTSARWHDDHSGRSK